MESESTMRNLVDFKTEFVGSKGIEFFQRDASK